MNDAAKPARKTATAEPDGFTDEERAAMKERSRELKATRRRSSKAAAADGESDVQAKIAEMTGTDHDIARRLHELIRASAPDLTPKTWYGMPAYARNGAIVCFFQPAQKFKSRYATLGFSDKAILDEATMWPTSFAVTELTPAAEAEIAKLLMKALS